MPVSTHVSTQWMKRMFVGVGLVAMLFTAAQTPSGLPQAAAGPAGGGELFAEPLRQSLVERHARSLP